MTIRPTSTPREQRCARGRSPPWLRSGWARGGRTIHLARQHVQVDPRRVTPSYVADRVRRAHPTGCSVVPGSTAVVSFGCVEAVGASYYDGSACHVDLVQWATDPTWAKLGRSVQSGLLRSDVAFLKRQLQSGSIELVLCNGRAVVDAFGAAMGSRFRNVGGVQVGVRGGAAQLVVGRYAFAQVIGWSVNLQSSFGVTNELRRLLADRAIRVVPSPGPKVRRGYPGDLGRLPAGPVACAAGRTGGYRGRCTSSIVRFEGP